MLVVGKLSGFETYNSHAFQSYITHVKQRLSASLLHRQIFFVYLWMFSSDDTLSHYVLSSFGLLIFFSKLFKINKWEYCKYYYTFKKYFMIFFRKKKLIESNLGASSLAGAECLDWCHPYFRFILNSVYLFMHSTHFTCFTSNQILTIEVQILHGQIKRGKPKHLNIYQWN